MRGHPNPGLRPGGSLIYISVAMVVFVGICSFAVDMGRIQLAKTQLQIAADAAARAGGVGLAISVSQAKQAAQLTAAANVADGTPVAIDPELDIEFGTWNASKRTFKPLTGSAQSSANALRVSVVRSQARGNAVPLVFARFFGQQTCDIHAESTVHMSAPVNINVGVQATANPFLAGMPKGTVASMNNPHNSPDYAGDSGNPRQSPFNSGLPLAPGSSISFSAISGSAGYDPDSGSYQPDGDISQVGHNTNGAENGISDVKAPINALVGVFLSDSQPNLTTAPGTLDFSTAPLRDFSNITPQLKQLFFIGDGKDSKGNYQTFTVPPGATRLYLATWDFYEWNNNFGTRTVQVTQSVKVTTVK